MKIVFYIVALLILVACEDQYEDTHTRTFSSLYRYKTIKLDAGKVLVDVQVKPAVAPGAAFKIVSGDQYIFVGEMMKGVHVYEKTDSRHATPLCFIECKYLKAFEVKGSLLFCNNFVDLLVVDVEDPAKAKILHREGGRFNYYSGGYQIPYDGTTFELTTIAEQLPQAGTFHDEAELYETVIVDEIPATLNYELPYAGFVKVDDVVYTNQFTCDYVSGHFTLTQSLIGNLFHYNFTDMRYEDKVLYTFGQNGYINYFDSEHALTQRKYYQWFSDLKDVAYMESQRMFWILTNSGSISGGMTLDGVQYPKSTVAPDVSDMLCTGDYLITLGKALTVYNTVPLPEPLAVVKQYPDIQGACMAEDGDNTLMVAGRQGLSFYDISNLENITLIP
jgi:hypothetical protein